MREKRKLRLAVSVVLSLVLAIAVFCGVFVLELSRGVLNRERLQQTISSKSYPYQMIEQMEADILKILEKNAIPASVLQEIWDEEELYRVFYQYSDEVLQNGTVPETDRYGLEEKLTQAIDSYLEDKGVVNTDVIDVQVKQTISDVSRTYNNYMYPSFLEKFSVFAIEFEQYTGIIVFVCFVVVVLCFVALWSMYKYKHHALEYAASGFLSAVFWNIPAVLWMGNGDWIAPSGIGPDYYRTLVEAFLQQGLWTGLMILAIELLIFLLLCALVREHKRKG